MRFLLTIIVSAVALLPGACSSSNTTSSPGEFGPEVANAADEPISKDSATLTVHGMSCPLCANNVDLQLMKVPGVRTVDVNLGDGRVKVSFATDQPHPTPAMLGRAIENSGFTLKGIE